MNDKNLEEQAEFWRRWTTLGQAIRDRRKAENFGLLVGLFAGIGSGISIAIVWNFLAAVIVGIIAFLIGAYAGENHVKAKQAAATIRQSCSTR